MSPSARATCTMLSTCAIYSSATACATRGGFSRWPGVPFASLEPHRLPSFFQCRPVGCVLERLVVFDERLFWVVLLQEHIAPRFERIGPVRPTLVCLLELRDSSREISVACQRGTP